MQKKFIAIFLISITLLIFLTYFANIKNQTITLAFVNKNINLIRNVFVQLYVFYPSENGTIFKEIYHGISNLYLSIQASLIKEAAKAWANKYGSLIHPSLIGFASYSENVNGSTIIYSQSFTVEYDPIKILNGYSISKAIVFNQPKVFNLTRIQKEFINAYQIITTTTSSSVRGYCDYYSYACYFLNSVTYYPSSNSFGIIPLIEADASEVYSQGYQNYIDGSIAVRIIASSQTTFQIDITEAFESKYGGISFSIPGPSMTIYSSSSSVTVNSYIWFGTALGNYPSKVMIYEKGQLALANYSVYYFDPGGYIYFVGYSYQLIQTGLEVLQSGDAKAPNLYTATGNFIPFDYSSSKYYGTLNPGQGIYIFGTQIEQNQIPNLAISIPVSLLFAAVAPEVTAALVLILPYINLIWQTSNMSYMDSIFYLHVSSSSPVSMVIRYDDAGVQYQYQGSYYNVPTTIFYIEPYYSASICNVNNSDTTINRIC
jgi:hypothetical protein